MKPVVMLTLTAEQADFYPIYVYGYTHPMLTDITCIQARVDACHTEVSSSVAVRWSSPLI